MATSTSRWATASSPWRPTRRPTSSTSPPGPWRGRVDGATGRAAGAFLTVGGRAHACDGTVDEDGAFRLRLPLPRVAADASLEVVVLSTEGVETRVTVPLRLDYAPLRRLVPVRREPLAGGGEVQVLGWRLPQGAGDLELVHVPAGGGVPHELWIVRTEVTRAQFAAYERSRPRGYDVPLKDGAERLPMTFITFERVRGFCEWAGVELPTAQEWEHAARGPDGRPYPWGTAWDPTLLNHGAGDGLEADADGHREASPVGAFPRDCSPFGALDMAGNVAEWCADLAPGSTDAKPLRALRGGSFHAKAGRSLAQQHELTAAQAHDPGEHRHDLGFRVVVRGR